MSTRLNAVFLAVALAAGACTSGTSTTTPRPADPETTAPPATASTETPDVDELNRQGQAVVDEVDKPDLELALVWHQHQPRYPVIGGEVSRPWVRLHAAKDYVDMASMVEEFEDLRLTINLTPVLLDQIVELSEGANDSYESVSRAPIGSLSPAQRRFLLDRFFDINPLIISRSERFADLRATRETGGDFSDQDLQDLRTLFHLGWIDPEIVAADPDLARLRDADGGYTDDDANLVLDRIDQLVSEVIPTHAALWNSGQIEVTTSPLAHPILPLVADTDLALAGDSEAILPRQPFRQPDDAALQVERGLERATALFGQTPNGMWPGEGAVAQDVMATFAENDIAWIGTGEDVLARSLDLESIERDAQGTVTEPAVLYRPHLAETREGDVAMFFRDNELSDRIGFDYASISAEAAVDDFMTRLDRIRSQLARTGVTAESDETPLVTVILDGENAWEGFENDGRDFLREFYGRLTSTDWLTTTTPSAYLNDHADSAGTIDEVFPAAWFSPNYATWIGEQEEARAWELLGLARADLETARRRGSASAIQLATATDAMLAAQGSDWFWWYGDDQDSGDDRYFDTAFRELLGQVYDGLGQARPPWVSTPIVPNPRVVPVSSTGEPVSVTIDGNPADFSDATTFDFTIDNDVISTLAVAADGDEIGLFFQGGYDRGMDIYLGGPRGAGTRTTSIDDRFELGFDATHLIRWDEQTGACLSGDLPPTSQVGTYPDDCVSIDSALSASGVEMAIPGDLLDRLTAGEKLQVRIQTGSSLSPSTGPAEVIIPDIGNFDEFRVIADPRGDDDGPGGYTYPTDSSFAAGSLDLVEVVVGESGPDPTDDYLFSFLFEAPIQNVWNAPLGMSLQTIDLYLDYDLRPGTGRRDLLPGRNASMPDTTGWEAAITLEGWEPALAVAQGRDGYAEVESGLSVSVLAQLGLVTARIPKADLPPGLDLETAGLGVAILSQDGFPAEGVRRVRSVTQSPTQWSLGGGDSAAGDTRIIDALSDGADSLAENQLPVLAP